MVFNQYNRIVELCITFVIMVLFPNAKINLGLLVTERRSDGFHNLETVFLPVGITDILEFVPSDSLLSKITVTGIELDSEPAHNLVMKAWQLMHEKYKIPAVEIALHKVIPFGAGLGGGSSDAAFMLKGLNDFFVCKASIAQLEEMAAEIGSDCAFFIQNKPALASGRGEVLTSISLPLAGYSILLVNPGIHISTREAYSQVHPQKPLIDLNTLLQQPIEKWQSTVFNDFEKSILPNHSAIAEIKEKLLAAGAVYSAMSGSGSTVYGIFKEPVPLIILQNFQPYYYWQGNLR